MYIHVCTGACGYVWVCVLVNEQHSIHVRTSKRIEYHFLIRTPYFLYFALGFVWEAYYDTFCQVCCVIQPNMLHFQGKGDVILLDLVLYKISHFQEVWHTQKVKRSTHYVMLISVSVMFVTVFLCVFYVYYTYANVPTCMYTCTCVCACMCHVCNLHTLHCVHVYLYLQSFVFALFWMEPHLHLHGVILW